METMAIKVLRALAQYGPLDVSSIRRILGIKSNISWMVKKLEKHGLIECGWLCKLTEKGKAALQYLDECGDVGCLSAKVDMLS
jgi:Mn-dependent DtxR family transcriptional regulator